MVISTIILIIGFIIIAYTLYNILKPSQSNYTYDTNTNTNGKEEGQKEDVLIDSFKAQVTLPTFALIFGNSETNPNVYGSKNRLNGVATDLKRVHSLLKSFSGIKNSYGKELTTAQADTFDYDKATSSAYADAIKRIADLGKSILGDKILFIYESGHGGQVFDATDNDKDKLAETRVFYDAMIKDDVTREYILKTLGKGWKVINVVDRCHSGGLAKEAFGFGEAQVKSIGIADKSLMINLPINNISNEFDALMKIQSAAKEGTYALDYGASMGGLMTYYWAESIVNNNGNISYEDINKYVLSKISDKQISELQDALGTNAKKWSNKKIFLT